MTLEAFGAVAIVSSMSLAGLRMVLTHLDGRLASDGQIAKLEDLIARNAAVREAEVAELHKLLGLERDRLTQLSNRVR